MSGWLFKSSVMFLTLVHIVSCGAFGNKKKKSKSSENSALEIRPSLSDKISVTKDKAEGIGNFEIFNGSGLADIDLAIPGNPDRCKFDAQPGQEKDANTRTYTLRLTYTHDQAGECNGTIVLKRKSNGQEAKREFKVVVEKVAPAPAPAPTQPQTTPTPNPTPNQQNPTNVINPGALKPGDFKINNGLGVAGQINGNIQAPINGSSVGLGAFYLQSNNGFQDTRYSLRTVSGPCRLGARSYNYGQIPVANTRSYQIYGAFSQPGTCQGEIIYRRLSDNTIVNYPFTVIVTAAPNTGTVNYRGGCYQK